MFHILQHFAMSLGKALEGNKKHLHQIVVSGLRKLLLKAANGESVEDTNCMARFAKNFLPRLNNVYLLEPKGTHEQGTRASALETIKVHKNQQSIQSNMIIQNNLLY